MMMAGSNEAWSKREPGRTLTPLMAYSYSIMSLPPIIALCHITLLVKAVDTKVCLGLDPST